ncbi:MAG: hypothetical protein ACOCU8_02700 [Patescibacteria group bacterium]
MLITHKKKFIITSLLIVFFVVLLINPKETIATEEEFSDRYENCVNSLVDTSRPPDDDLESQINWLKERSAFYLEKSFEIEPQLEEMRENSDNTFLRPTFVCAFDTDGLCDYEPRDFLNASVETIEGTLSNSYIISFPNGDSIETSGRYWNYNEWFQKSSDYQSLRAERSRFNALSSEILQCVSLGETALNYENLNPEEIDETEEELIELENYAEQERRESSNTSRAQIERLDASRLDIDKSWFCLGHGNIIGFDFGDPVCYIELFTMLFEVIRDMVVSILTEIISPFYDTVIHHSVIEITQFLDTDSANQVWIAVRDVANLFFIFILLYVSFSITLQIGGANDKRLIAMVIIIALLINFSAALTKVAIDASNITALHFLEQIDEDGEVGTRLQITSKFSTLSASQLPGGDNQIEREAAWKRLMATVANIVFAFILIIALLVGSFLYLWRVVIFLILIVASPLAFVGFALPKIKTMITDKWLSQLFCWCAFAPISMFFLWASFTLAEGTNLEGGFFELMIHFFIICALVIGSFVMSQILSCSGSSSIAGRGVGALNYTKDKAATGLKHGAGKTAKWAATSDTKKYGGKLANRIGGLKDTGYDMQKSDSRTKRVLGRASEWVGDKGQKIADKTGQTKVQESKVKRATEVINKGENADEKARTFNRLNKITGAVGMNRLTQADWVANQSGQQLAELANSIKDLKTKEDFRGNLDKLLARDPEKKKEFLEALPKEQEKSATKVKPGELNKETEIERNREAGQQRAANVLALSNDKKGEEPSERQKVLAEIDTETLANMLNSTDNEADYQQLIDDLNQTLDPQKMERVFEEMAKDLSKTLNAISFISDPNKKEELMTTELGRVGKMDINYQQQAYNKTDELTRDGIREAVISGMAVAGVNIKDLDQKLPKDKQEKEKTIERLEAEDNLKNSDANTSEEDIKKYLDTLTTDMKVNLPDEVLKKERVVANLDIATINKLTQASKTPDLLREIGKVVEELKRKKDPKGDALWGSMKSMTTQSMFFSHNDTGNTGGESSQTSNPPSQTSNQSTLKEDPNSFEATKREKQEKSGVSEEDEEEANQRLKKLRREMRNNNNNNNNNNQQ